MPTLRSGLFCDCHALFLAQSGSASLATFFPKSYSRWVPVVLWLLLYGLAYAEIDNQLAKLVRVTRSFRALLHTAKHATSSSSISILIQSHPGQTDALPNALLGSTSRASGAHVVEEANTTGLPASPIGPLPPSA